MHLGVLLGFRKHGGIPDGDDMGWLRLVGSLKLQVSSAKEPYKRVYILQKRPIILRSLLIVADPYPHTASQYMLYAYGGS